jgi:hypothetical protein
MGLSSRKLGHGQAHPRLINIFKMRLSRTFLLASMMLACPWRTNSYYWGLQLSGASKTRILCCKEASLDLSKGPSGLSNSSRRIDCAALISREKQGPRVVPQAPPGLTKLRLKSKRPIVLIGESSYPNPKSLPRRRDGSL